MTTDKDDGEFKQQGKTSEEEEEPPDQDSVENCYSWFVMVVSFIGQVLIYGISWTVGVYFVIFLGVFQEEKGPTSWIGSITTAFSYLAGPVSSVLMKKTGMRWMMVIGGTIAAAGLAASAFATNIYHLYITFGVITGSGLGLAYVPCITSVGFYFDKHRTVAVGISSSGVGIGTFIYPPLIRYLVAEYGWRGSLLILSGITLNLVVIGAFIRPIEVQNSGNDKNKSETGKPARGNIVKVLDLNIFKNGRYLLLCLNNLILLFGFSIVYVHIAAYAESVGIESQLSAMLFSVMGIMNFIGRVGFGLIGHIPRLNIVLAYIVILSVGGLPIVFVPIAKDYAPLVVIVALYGFFSASVGTYLPDVLIEFLCLHRLPSGYGYVLIFEGLGQLVGAPTAGMMFDSTQSYVYSFYLGGICMIVANLILIPALMKCMQHKHVSEGNILSQPSLMKAESGSLITVAGEPNGSEADIRESTSLNKVTDKPELENDLTGFRDRFFGRLAGRRTSSAQCICQYPPSDSNQYLSAVPARLGLYQASSARSLRSLNRPTTSRSQQGSTSSIFAGSHRTMF